MSRKPSLFDDYLLYSAKQGSPECFHFWTAATLVSSILERRVWLDRGPYRNYPNLYTILVSNSALCYKSTAINMGIDRFFKKGRDRRVYIIQDRLTPEVLLKALSSNEGGKTAGANSNVGGMGKITLTKNGLVTSRPALLYSDELGALLSRYAIANGVIEVLLQLYTCPPDAEYNTKESGSFYIWRPCLNLLSATTPHWIKNNINERIYGEGLVGRVIFVFSDTPKGRIAHPEVDPEGEKAVARIDKHLTRIKKLQGPFSYGKGVKEEFQRWFETREEPVDSVLETGFWGREPEHVLSLCQILSAGRGDSMLLTMADLRESITRVEEVRKNLISVFSQSFSGGGDPKIQRIEEFLSRKKTATRSEITKAMYRHMNAKEVGQCLERLKRAKKIQSEKTLGGGQRFQLVTS